MSLDAINKKQDSESSPKKHSQKKFIIPIIIILVVIFAVWLAALRYNFSRINEKSEVQDQDSAGQQINNALKDLGQRLENLKEQKVFSNPEQDNEATSTQATSTNDNQELLEPEPETPNQY
ncbi:hypothetical protein HQ544_05455 [Candidatus Falkowbacteria bacterium]|nr:hypothetical protein [Candidatus Falkowbacteria bacterium]